MAKKTVHQLQFNSMHLEGGLFIPDILEKAALGEAERQKPLDYLLPKGLKFQDEYGRAYQISKAQWETFIKKVSTEQDKQAAEITGLFILEFFTDVLGWKRLSPVSHLTIRNLTYPVHFLGYEAIPLVVSSFFDDLDHADVRFAVSGSSHRKRTPFQMVQEYLNSLEIPQWGIVSNGKKIRLLRSSTTLARPHFLEFDLDDIMEEERYVEFISLWRILHGSRVQGRSSLDDQSVWDIWRSQGIEEGHRVREGLRDGVTRALIFLGTGFLSNKLNEKLRRDLDTGSLTVDAYFQQLLRLIYRFLFIFALEERKSGSQIRLIHTQEESPEAQEARELYEEGYSSIRLKSRTLRKSSYDSHTDLWQAQVIVFRALSAGEKRLALPALGGLFSTDMCTDLDTAELTNKALLEALYYLRWTAKSGTLTPVDYKNMGVEELGSVYESLLELVPKVELQSRIFEFIGITLSGSTAGNARKTTGSYYTPDSLVQQLIKTALIPVLETRLQDHPDKPEESLLSLTVIDPSCGSGHFLLAAARAIAERLAIIRNPDDVLLPKDYRHALREVISRCIFGVDRNPMAVELTRTGLWLEGYEPGKPLSFLNHHIVCGDSLLGLMDLDVLKNGIPQDAYKALSGDDKTLCSRLKTQNMTGLKSLQEYFNQPELELHENSVIDSLITIESLEENTVDAVKEKEQAWQKTMQQVKEDPRSVGADLFVGAFILPKKAYSSSVPTSQTLMRLLIGSNLTLQDKEAIVSAQRKCSEARVLHWPITFAHIFEKGGFDVVLGNPPWERIKLQDQEFFATRDPMIAGAKNKAVRSRMIEKLRESESYAERQLHSDYLTAKNLSEAVSQFAHLKKESSGRFFLTGIGDVNLYALFAETIHAIQKKTGRAGFIVPSGIATDDSTKVFFGSLIGEKQLAFLVDFENRNAIFPGVHRSYKFCLLTLGPAEAAEFSFFLTDTAQVSDRRRHFALSAEDFDRINPNTRTCPIFRSQKDAEITKKIYSKIPILINELDTEKGNLWGVKFSTMFHMSNDSTLFLDSRHDQALPLYEAKMMHQFDHRWATYDDEGEHTRDVSVEEKQRTDYEPTPRYWVDTREVLYRIADVPKPVLNAWKAGDTANLKKALSECHKDPELQALSTAGDVISRVESIIEQRSPKWLMGWRDITNATNERTVIASVIPRSGVGNNMPLFFLKKEISNLSFLLLANMISFVVDFIARQKVGGTHLNFFLIRQLPIIPPDLYSSGNKEYIKPRVIELVYTSKALRPWAEELGYKGEPFLFDPERRAILRAELDAYYARLYGLTREELSYILDPASVMGEEYPSETFRVLKKNEIANYGEYRTMRLVLEAWDALEGEG